MALCFFSQVVLTIAGQQVGVAPKTNILSGSYYLQLAYALSVLNMCVILAGGVSVALLATSISDMVNHGEDMAGRRRCTNIVFWTVIIAYLLSMLSLISGVSVIWAWDLSVARILMFILMVFPTVTFPAVLIASTVLIVIAHRKMRTVSVHPTPTHYVRQSPRAHHDHRSYARSRHQQRRPLFLSN